MDSAHSEAGVMYRECAESTRKESVSCDHPKESASGDQPEESVSDDQPKESILSHRTLLVKERRDVIRML